MTTSAAYLMKNAGIMLQDEQHIRWTLPELARWIDEGIKTICLANPSAATRSTIFSLKFGTRQRLPLTLLDNGDQPLGLKKIVRNIDDPKQPETGGRVITVVSAKILDAQEPNWQNSKVVSFNKTVRHYVYDEKNPLEFYVYPGNNGAGCVEAVVAYCPAAISKPSKDSNAGLNNIETWDTPIGLPDPYSTCVAEYLMYRALLKDDTTGSTSRANYHFSQFQTMLTAKSNGDNTTSPNLERLQQ